MKKDKKWKPSRYKDGEGQEEKVGFRYKEKRKGGWVYILLIVLFSGVFVFSGIMLLGEIFADMEAESTKKGLQNIVTLLPQAPIIYEEEDEEENTKELSFYSIADFSEIEALNSDTVGWFYMPGETDSKGLPIDLPLLYTSNDSFYLDHDFYKKPQINGWVYVSSDCEGEDITKNRNLLIYGHARSYQMFGGLKNLNRDKAWQENKEGHYIKISTPYEDSIWQIFSWHETDIYDSYWQTAFSSDSEFVEYCYRVQSQDQLHCFDTFEFTKDDRVLTLSTCKGVDENVRVAVHAKLILTKDREKTE